MPTSKRKTTARDIFMVRVPQSINISQDGEWIIFAVRDTDVKKNAYTHAIYRVPTGGGRLQPLPRGKAHDCSPRWRQDRDEVTSWSTPLIVTVCGIPQVVTSATNRVRDNELLSGKLLWEHGGMTVSVVPTPVALANLVLVTSGFRGYVLMAINLETVSDDPDMEAVVWSLETDAPSVS